MDPNLFVAVVLVLVAANDAVWLVWGRVKDREIDNIQGRLERVQDERDHAVTSLLAAQSDIRALASKNAPLKARNDMLSGLVAKEGK